MADYYDEILAKVDFDSLVETTIKVDNMEQDGIIMSPPAPVRLKFWESVMPCCDAYCEYLKNPLEEKLARNCFEKAVQFYNAWVDCAYYCEGKACKEEFYSTKSFESLGDKWKDTEGNEYWNFLLQKRDIINDICSFMIWDIKFERDYPDSDRDEMNEKIAKIVNVSLKRGAQPNEFIDTIDETFADDDNQEDSDETTKLENKFFERMAKITNKQLYCIAQTELKYRQEIEEAKQAELFNSMIDDWRNFVMYKQICFYLMIRDIANNKRETRVSDEVLIEVMMEMGCQFDVKRISKLANQFYNNFASAVNKNQEGRHVEQVPNIDNTSDANTQSAVEDDSKPMKQESSSSALRLMKPAALHGIRNSAAKIIMQEIYKSGILDLSIASIDEYLYFFGYDKVESDSIQSIPPKLPINWNGSRASLQARMEALYPKTMTDRKNFLKLMDQIIYCQNKKVKWSKDWDKACENNKQLTQSIRNIIEKNS